MCKLLQNIYEKKIKIEVADNNHFQIGCIPFWTKFVTFVKHCTILAPLDEIIIKRKSKYLM